MTRQGIDKGGGRKGRTSIQLQPYSYKTRCAQYKGGPLFENGRREKELRHEQGTREEFATRISWGVVSQNEGTSEINKFRGAL